MTEYMPILDDRRLDDELAEARRILNYYRLMFVSGNENPVRQRMIEANDIVVRDTAAFFERWPVTGWQILPRTIGGLSPDRHSHPTYFTHSHDGGSQPHQHRDGAP